MSVGLVIFLKSLIVAFLSEFKAPWEAYKAGRATEADKEKLEKLEQYAIKAYWWCVVIFYVFLALFLAWLWSVTRVSSQ